MQTHRHLDGTDLVERCGSQPGITGATHRCRVGAITQVVYGRAHRRAVRRPSRPGSRIRSPSRQRGLTLLPGDAPLQQLLVHHQIADQVLGLLELLLQDCHLGIVGALLEPRQKDSTAAGWPVRLSASRLSPRSSRSTTSCLRLEEQRFSLLMDTSYLSYSTTN